jgi:hypothetical protein
MKKLIKKYKKEIIFSLFILGILTFHFYTIKQLKQDEQNLIEAFRSGQFQEFQNAKKRNAYNYRE